MRTIIRWPTALAMVAGLLLSGCGNGDQPTAGQSQDQGSQTQGASSDPDRDAIRMPANRGLPAADVRKSDD